VTRLAGYLLWQLPGWALAALVLWWLHAFVGLPTWAALLVLGVLIAKDLALYRVMRATFRPARAPLLGSRGRAVETLAPTGYVRVEGELWRARCASPGRAIAGGSPVIVREAHGLTLVVEADPAPATPAGPHGSGAP
jgi:membrane protein implicated in regulation of membrane protease activity